MARQHKTNYCLRRGLCVCLDSFVLLEFSLLTLMFVFWSWRVFFVCLFQRKGKVREEGKKIKLGLTM